ncbi:shikimate dehydrogenase [Gordonibacter sp. 28C]|uniref:shikimate dehydrogenase family protein n=1 Tax=Gordonibacter sp. 28C TaxID=2078569 RepID=UPI000DF72744|nr:shikimate dehydrogenase [Gordonibacter sp. 28C]RDB62832.1 shikimate dehydrogenase [Gordonibacter sp. 28C]
MSEATTAENLYLLGHPIAHSKSPAMYNAVYERLGLPWRYELADKAGEDEARAFLDARDFLSVNITTPYKPLAYEAATHKAASAKLARGANLLVRHGEALLAYNTDGQGCVAYLERTGFDFAGCSVVVCGTGPTALSIVHACAIAGADEVVLVGRDKERARDVLDAYVQEFGRLSSAAVDLPAAQEHHRSFRQAYDGTTFKFGSYATSTQAIHGADLVVNATPLGMRADDPAPFDVALFCAGQRAFDVVYGHGETAFVAGARAADCTVSDGAGMLVAQAEATVRTVCDIAGADVDLETFDLFAVMAEAADFDLG